MRCEPASGRQPLAQANRIEGTLVNVESLAIDLNGACLGSGPVAYDLTTDGPVTVLLSDGRTLVLDGSGPHQGSF